MSTGTLVLGAVLVTAAIIAIVLLHRNHRQDLYLPGYSASSNPLTIKPGDVIEIDEEGWFHVLGSLVVIEQTHIWTKHLIDDTDDRWCCVEETDAGTVVTLWTGVSSVFVQVEQGIALCNGIAHVIEDRGYVRYRSVGVTRLPETGEIGYAEFRGHARGEATFLAGERFDDGDWRYSVGRIVPEHALVIHPSVA